LSFTTLEISLMSDNDNSDVYTFPHTVVGQMLAGGRPEKVIDPRLSLQHFTYQRTPTCQKRDDFKDSLVISEFKGHVPQLTCQS
jgi:hypothetical protein